MIDRMIAAMATWMTPPGESISIGKSRVEAIESLVRAIIRDEMEKQANGIRGVP